MIVIVAPYSSIENSSRPNLGAARKIEMVIEALCAIDSVLLVNSAHNDINTQAGFSELCISGYSIRQYVPSIFSNSKLGKLANLGGVDSDIDKCLSIGDIKFLWIYNAYAYENLFCFKLRARVNVPVFFEFEDDIFSRNRGLNIKPYLDNYFWKKNRENIDYAFAVNDKLLAKLSSFSRDTSLLPGVVSDELISLCTSAPPFTRKEISIGYFGGLSTEKGVDTILKTIQLLPDDYQFVICGAGPLEEDLLEISLNQPAKLVFHGRVSEQQLYSAMSRCDVILNPHSSVELMGDGVFPFKVVEAIASARLVISTRLPALSIPGLLDGVQFYDEGAQELLGILLKSRELYASHSENIGLSSTKARDLFSVSGLASKVLSFYKGGDAP